jgi:hypothetical protein
MMTLTNEFRKKVLDALLAIRSNFDGTDQGFAKQWAINGSIFSRMKKGRVEGVLADSHWIRIGRELGVGTKEKKWKTAKTAVFTTIEQDILFCKEHSKAKIFVDECAIGKTHTAKYLSLSLSNCFYIDGSQAKSRQQFVRRIARAIGVDQIGTLTDVKENIKYWLKLLPKPIIIIDEAGDLDYNAFLELKEFWNATEGYCGWYMMGADGLRAKIERGISNQKVGYRELLSRFSSKYTTAVPKDKQEKIAFYKTLLRDVLEANMEDKTGINDIINRCITKDGEDNIGGLRRAESILLLNSQNQ